MERGIRSHIRSNIVGYVALFVALSLGTAWAASLPKNSVGPKQIEKNAVKAPEIAKDAVRMAEVRANAVGTEEVADASLLSEDFAPGQLPQGPQGERGIPGEPATKLFAYIRDTVAGPNPTASVAFGSGVSAVTDPDGSNTYTVNFDRSLANCVVQAVAGLGTPAGAASTTSAFPIILVNAGEQAHQAQVSFFNPSGGLVDTAFMITAFC